MRMLRKSGVILLIVISISLLLSGCGSTSSGIEDGKLVVATDAAYAPMEYLDDEGNIVGLDIDIVKAIAEAVDIEVEFKNYGWEPLFSAVENEEVDFAVSSITITDERKESFDFSEPYFVANQLILVPADSQIETFEDLKGKKVAVQINTTGHEVVKGLLGKTSSDIVAPESMPLAITEMLNGNADAAVGDNTVVLEYVKNNPNVEVKTIEDDSFEKENYGLMVKKGNEEVVELLNEGIQEIKDSGKLQEIIDSYLK
ncbi:basic amino acid ABC transporter substrate-binding protein [Ornithinibacillus scapharcae]|uniref:basic amino acid ABC transporter substrate-binding protein n=1 Tax=Ornithinibacillus scapharcae TaxID=1147159 RepID=UPI000225AAB3|nr:basic amino acid ABC transporter substrate-binding protein [Ornithinibacillus scapharcae]